MIGANDQNHEREPDSFEEAAFKELYDSARNRIAGKVALGQEVTVDEARSLLETTRAYYAGNVPQVTIRKDLQ